jgi:hypothetical protein
MTTSGLACGGFADEDCAAQASGSKPQSATTALADRLLIISPIGMKTEFASADA